MDRSLSLNNVGAQYDPDSGRTVHFPFGQAEGIGHSGTNLIFGIYTHARIAVWDTRIELPAGRGPSDLFAIPGSQDRPFVITSGEGKVFIGTIPDYGEHGGSLTVYDETASEAAGRLIIESHRHIVQDQSIVGLAYKNGKLYGSTSIFSGLGAEPKAVRAKLFVWDVAQKYKITEKDLELPGLRALPMIGALSAGPDGLIWGTANGTLFALDPETCEIVRFKNIYPDIAEYGKWRPVYIRWSRNGLLAANVAGRLTIVNPSTLEFRPLHVSAPLFTLDRHDNLYYAAGTRLQQIPGLFEVKQF